MKQKTNIFLLLALFFVAACSKKTEVEPITQTSTNSSFELIQNKILTTSCATTGCHASTNDASFKQHKLVLKGTDVYKNLVNAPVTNTKAMAAGLSQIVPKDLDKSFFYQKLIFEKSIHKYGNAMPLGADALSEKQITFIKDWIIAGAPEKGNVIDEKLLLN